MLELRGIASTLSLPTLPSSLLPGVMALDRVLSMGQIELFDILSECKQITYAELNCLK